MQNFSQEYVKKYIGEVSRLIQSGEAHMAESISAVSALLAKARTEKSTIFLMGNGGSASTASHIAQDLAKCTISEGKPRFKVISLADNIPGMLAWANDSSYEDIFVEQLKNLMSAGDVIIGISGSGNSKNVIKAIDYANQSGGITIGICGYDGGKLKKNASHSVHIPSFNMQMVEDLHVMVLHILISMLRDTDC